MQCTESKGALANALGLVHVYVANEFVGAGYFHVVLFYFLHSNTPFSTVIIL